MAIDTTRALIAQITNASQVGENTATRVGTTMDAMLDDVKDASDLATLAESKADNVVSRIAAEESVNAAQDVHIAGLQAALANVQQVTIQGNVTNNPDQVFLTSENDLITPKERTTSDSAKGHYIMRQGEFAAKLKANYIHEIPFDVDLGGGSVTIPTGATLKFTGGKISNGTINFQDTFLDGDVQLASTAFCVGTISNIVAKQCWFENNDIDAWHRFIRNVVCENYEYTEGTYYPTTVLVADNRSRININGNNAKLIWQAPTSDVDTNLSGGININRSFVNFSNFAIANPISINSHEFTAASGHGLSVGDTIVLMDTRANSFTNGYLNGEFLRVRTVNGNTIGLATKTFAQYPTTADTIGARVEQTRVSISNLFIEYMTDSSTEYRLWHGLNVMNAEGTISNVKVNGFHRAINAQYCCGIVVDSCEVNPLQRASSGVDHYGISINNCQRVNVCNCNITGGQHGLTTGGYEYYNGGRNVFNIPNREIHINNNTIANEQQVSWASIGMHPNIEYAIVSNNIVGGVSISGSNVIVSGNLIRKGVNTQAVNVANPITFNHTIINNMIEQGTIMLTASRVSRTSNPNMYEDTAPETLLIANNTGDVHMWLRPSKGGATKKISAKVNGNTFNAWASTNILVKSDFDEIEFNGNSFYDNVGRGCLTFGDVEQVIIKDCIFDVRTGTQSPITIGGSSYLGNDLSVGEIRVDGCTFKGACSRPRITQFGNSGTVDFARLVVRNNYFLLNGTFIWAVNLYTDSSCKMFIFEDNFFEKEAGGNYVSGSCATARFGRNKFLGAMDNGNAVHQNVTATTMDNSQGWSAYRNESGTKANRPSLTIRDRGYMYFATDLDGGKPIWWTGAVWKDSTGTTIT